MMFTKRMIGKYRFVAPFFAAAAFFAAAFAMVY